MQTYYALKSDPDSSTQWELVVFLLDEVVTPEDARQLAAFSDDPHLLPVLMRLLDRGIRPDAGTLVTAVSSGQSMLLPVLLAHGADVNGIAQFPYSEVTALMAAARTGRQGASAVLLDAGADSNIGTPRPDRIDSSDRTDELYSSSV